MAAAFLANLTVAVEYVGIGLIGLVFGSYVSLVSYRLPRDLPTVFDRSRCIRCQRPLRPVDLVPVLTWVVRRGRCGCGEARLPWRYPVIEMATAGAVLVAWSLAADRIDGAILSALAIALMIAVAADLETLIIPDETVIAVVVLAALWYARPLVEPAVSGTLVPPAWEPVALALSGAAAGVLVALALRGWFLYSRGIEALGRGDVKLMAAGGLWVGLDGLAIWFIAAGSLGLVTGIGWRFAGWGARFPFGPGLAAGIFVAVGLRLTGIRPF